MRCLTFLVALTFAQVCLAGGPPIVTGVSPGSGPASGGTTVTISGANFFSSDCSQLWRNRGNVVYGQHHIVHHRDITG